MIFAHKYIAYNYVAIFFALDCMDRISKNA